MAIQFRCSACTRQIEVDDEFGGQEVKCPYCATMVFAPRASVLGSARTVHAEAAHAPLRPNVVGVVGLVLALLALVLLVVTVMGARSALEQRAAEMGLTIEQTLERMQQESLQQQSRQETSASNNTPGTQPATTQPSTQPTTMPLGPGSVMDMTSPAAQKFFAYGMTACLGMLALPAALICCLVGLRSVYRTRQPAIAGLILLTIAMVFVVAQPGG